MLFRYGKEVWSQCTTEALSESEYLILGDIEQLYIHLNL